ncbi:hypothetical protein D3C78_1312780 [compost metagenome]
MVSVHQVRPFALKKICCARLILPPRVSSALNLLTTSPRTLSKNTPRLERISRWSACLRPCSRPPISSPMDDSMPRPWYRSSEAATGRSVTAEITAPPSLAIDCQARMFDAMRAPCWFTAIRAEPSTSANRFCSQLRRSVWNLRWPCGLSFRSCCSSSRMAFQFDSGLVPSRRMRPVFCPIMSRPPRNASRSEPAP